MLLISNICALCSYTLLIFVIVRLYCCFQGKQQYLMLTSLGIMYILLAILLWFAWKGSIDKKSANKKTDNDLQQDLSWLSMQYKSRYYCMVPYVILLIVGSIVFFLDIHHGLTLILKLSTPLGVLAFLTGIYFIITFSDQNTYLQPYKDRLGI